MTDGEPVEPPSFRACRRAGFSFSQIFRNFDSRTLNNYGHHVIYHSFSSDSCVNAGRPVCFAGRQCSPDEPVFVFLKRLRQADRCEDLERHRIWDKSLPDIQAEREILAASCIRLWDVSRVRSLSSLWGNREAPYN